MRLLAEFLGIHSNEKETKKHMESVSREMGTSFEFEREKRENINVAEDKARDDFSEDRD